MLQCGAFVEPRQQADLHINILRLDIDPFSPAVPSIVASNQKHVMRRVRSHHSRCRIVRVMLSTAGTPRGQTTFARLNKHANVLPERAWLNRTWSHVAGRNPSRDQGREQEVWQSLAALCALSWLFADGQGAWDVHLQGTWRGALGRRRAHTSLATLSGELAAAAKKSKSSLSQS